MKFIYLLFSLLMICACSNSYQSSTNDEINSRSGTSSSVDEPNATIDLTTHLKRFSGLVISGQGSGARISIRGVNSFTAGTEPLILLDDGPVGSYANLFHSVLVANIKRIEVLKNPNDIAIYGVRGANGVLKVTTN